MKKYVLLLTGLVFFTGSALAQITNAERLSSLSEIRRFAFASCNHQTDPQPLWNELIHDAPDLFIWGGDNVYADSLDASVIKEAYAYQDRIEDYQFFKLFTPIIGTWDDHDYGYNNGDGSFDLKRQSQNYLLDFLEEPLMSPRRVQNGVYTSYSFGEGAKKIKFILIDNRFFKDVDPTAPFLGREQWMWLNDELKNSDAAVNFIVSGLSVLSPPLPWSEEWVDYPPEQEKLLHLIEKYKVSGVVFLTGDKHFASIFEAKGHLEFMSSGMTHNTRLPLRPYVRRKFPDPYFQLNYGLVDINWDGETPFLTLAIRNAFGQSAQRRKFQLSGRHWKETSL